MQHFGIIGNPLGHSQSKRYFEALFRAEGLPADYTEHEIRNIEEVRPLLEALEGMNVTSPYKEQIIPYLQTLDPVAARLGAVNVVYHGKGYNTDWKGVRQALGKHLRETDSQALVLGTGGAAKAVKYALEQMGLSVHTVSRKHGHGTFTYTELTQEIIEDHTVIANCTPLGMVPHAEEAPAILYDALSSKHMLFDCIYNPAETVFLRHGRERGAQTVNGEAMFRAQAEEAWKIFNGVNE